MIRKTLVITIVALSCALGHAQTYQPIVYQHPTFVNGSGLPCAGCSLYSYQAGTTTAQATFSDCTSGTVNTNPIILGTDGGANICINNLSYKFALVDTSGSPVWTVDNVTGWLNSLAGYLPLSGGTLSGTLTAPAVTLTGAGLTDWHDTTGQCKVNRGYVNILDCGAVANGAFVAGACSQVSPIGCWTGTDNYTAVHKAEAAVAANGGGVIYFPPSGTNVWMVGSSSECTDTVGGTSSKALFALANGTTVQGAGKNVTTIMAMPTTGTSTACWMFGSSTTPAYNIVFQDLRLDGNEPTDATHNDLLHANNNLSTNTNKLGAIFIQPTTSNVAMLNTAAATIQRTQITGFTGVIVPNPLIPNISSFALWFGPYGRVYLADNDVYMNEWAGAIFTQSPDSTYYDNYFNQDNSWNAYPQIVELETGTVRWIHNYFGGGFGATYVGLGVQHNLYIGNMNDFPGPGITAQCSNVTPVWGCGSNYIFADSGTPIYSIDNQIIGGTVSDTYATYPAILFAQHSARNTVANVDFNSSGSGHPVPTYLVQELNAAANTMVLNPTIDETPSSGNYSFLSSASSSLGSVGAVDTFHNALSYQVNSNTVLPSTLTGFHGNSAGIDVQGSDGTGGSGNFPKFDANGNLTNSALAANAIPQAVNSCGSTVTCSNTAQTGTRIVTGTVALSSGTPSTAVVTSMTAFASTSSFVCTVTNMTTQANPLKVANTSTSSITITGPNTVTDTAAYICIGN